MTPFPRPGQRPPTGRTRMNTNGRDPLTRSLTRPCWSDTIDTNFPALTIPIGIHVCYMPICLHAIHLLGAPSTELLSCMCVWSGNTCHSCPSSKVYARIVSYSCPFSVLKDSTVFKIGSIGPILAWIDRQRHENGRAISSRHCRTRRSAIMSQWRKTVPRPLGKEIPYGVPVS